MAVFGLLILFGLSCLLFRCEGKVSPPSDGTNLIFARGSTRRIVWSYDDVITTVSRRIWSFKSSDGKLDEILGFLDGDGGVMSLTSLLEVGIEKPATLVLRNVNETYDGTYKFGLQPSNGVAQSEVVVSIAVTPMVTVECSNPATVNTSDDFECICKGQASKPANVTWYKGNEKKSGPGKEEQLLRLLNVNKNDSGTYICKVKSHEIANNETEVELLVNYPPENVKLLLTRSDESATIRCTSDALPQASFKIFLNQTKEVKSDQMHTIPVVEKIEVGYYTCFAWNFLGSKTSDPEYLPLKRPLATRPTTTSGQKTTTEGNETANDKASSNNTSCRTEWYIVVVSLVSGIIIGILLSYIVSCSRRKLRGRKPQSNPEPKTTKVDTTYQELDLSKMNTEDNYQSLRVNAAKNEAARIEEATYTQLNKFRDVEDNYQSLT